MHKLKSEKIGSRTAVLACTYMYSPNDFQLHRHIILIQRCKHDASQYARHSSVQIGNSCWSFDSWNLNEVNHECHTLSFSDHLARYQSHGRAVVCEECQDNTDPDEKPSSLWKRVKVIILSSTFLSCAIIVGTLVWVAPWHCSTVKCNDNNTRTCQHSIM